jgi:hypothetical protein
MKGGCTFSNGPNSEDSRRISLLRRRSTVHFVMAKLDVDQQKSRRGQIPLGIQPRRLTLQLARQTNRLAIYLVVRLPIFIRHAGATRSRFTTR